MVYYQSDKLADRVDWDAIMPLDRCSGGHDEQMQALLKDATILGHYNEGDYQGNVATCVRLNDTGEVVIYNDSYGSCSGCDAWENAPDEEVRQMCRQLACGAYVFPNLTECVDFLTHGNVEKSYDWDDTRTVLLAEIPEQLIADDVARLLRESELRDTSTRQDMVII